MVGGGLEGGIEAPRGGGGIRSPWLVLGLMAITAGVAAWYLDRFPTPYQNMVRNTVLNNISVIVCCVPGVVVGVLMVLFAFSKPRREPEPRPERPGRAGGPAPPPPACPKCGSIRLNHKLDGRIQCNSCGHEW